MYNLVEHQRCFARREQQFALVFYPNCGAHQLIWIAGLAFVDSNQRIVIEVQVLKLGLRTQLFAHTNILIGDSMHWENWSCNEAKPLLHVLNCAIAISVSMWRNVRHNWFSTLAAGSFIPLTSKLRQLLWFPGYTLALCVSSSEE